MEMYNSSGNLMVSPIYQVRPVEAVAMYVNPDQKDEKRGRQEERRSRASSPKDGKNYQEIQKQKAEDERADSKGRTEEENLPFMLWLCMAGENNRIKEELK